MGDIVSLGAKRVARFFAERLAQTSLFVVCDAPKGHFKERRSALASLSDRSLRESADPKNQGSAPAHMKRNQEDYGFHG
jgi:hypothetical protein